MNITPIQIIWLINMTISFFTLFQSHRNYRRSKFLLAEAETLFELAKITLDVEEENELP